MALDEKLRDLQWNMSDRTNITADSAHHTPLPQPSVVSAFLPHWVAIFKWVLFTACRGVRCPGLHPQLELARGTNQLEYSFLANKRLAPFSFSTSAP